MSPQLLTPPRRSVLVARAKRPPVSRCIANASPREKTADRVAIAATVKTQQN